MSVVALNLVDLWGGGYHIYIYIYISIYDNAYTFGLLQLYGVFDQAALHDERQLSGKEREVRNQTVLSLCWYALCPPSLTGHC